MTPLLFFMSTILITYEDMLPFAQTILWYNSLVHIRAPLKIDLRSDYVQ